MRTSTKLLAGLAALALMGAASQVSAACTNGDVNGGGLSATDAAILLACNGTRTSPPANPNPALCAPGNPAICGGAGILDCGDVNLDGQITTADAILVLNDAIAPGKNVIPLCASQGPTVPCGSVITAGHITANEVLANCEYTVNGTVFVDPGVVLTVRPGALVKGVSGASTVSALVFLPAPNCTAASPSPFTARINAAGTPTQPIIFTSDQPVGSRKSGDWGGLAFNGCSRVNDAGGISEAEGLTGVDFGGGVDCRPSDGGPVGGTALCSDSSGLMRYTRIEFAGNELSPDNELNSLTQNGLGSNTKFTYIQTHMGLDDNFEWFGGTIQEKHFVSTGARDDNFDWQLGSDIKLQFAVSAQYLPNLDALTDNGYEGDNNERGFDNLSLSQPEFCNITLIGAKGQNGVGNYPTGGSWFGVFLRRGTAARIAKSIVTNWITGGMTLRDPESSQHACTGTSAVRSNGIAAPTNNPNSGFCFGPVAHGVGACFVDGDCPAGDKCLPYNLVDTASADKVCSTGPNVGQTCVSDAFCAPGTCGRNNLLMQNTLFYDNGDSTHGGGAAVSHTNHAVNKSGGNNTGSRCNAAEWLALLQDNATLKVRANTTYPDATLDPGIAAGPSWPPVSFQPTNVAAVTDSFDCGANFGSFFEPSSYIGGIDPSGADWTQTPGGWISFVTQ